MKKILIIFILLLTSLQAKDTQKKNLLKKHNKSYVPVQFTWEYSPKEIKVNSIVSVKVKITSLKDLANTQIAINLHPALKFVSGNTELNFAQWNKGETKTLEFSVIPVLSDRLYIHTNCNTVLDGVAMGTVDSIEFETVEFKSSKPNNLEEGVTVLPGRTN